MKKWLKRISVGVVITMTALWIGVFTVPSIRSQVMQVSGLAVAQSTILWNHLKDAAQGDDLTNGVGAMGMYGWDGANFDRIRVNASGAMQAEIVGAVTPADNYANPTTALQDYALIGVFDGATWDRALSSTHGDGLITTYGLNVAGFGYEFDGANWDRGLSSVHGDNLTTAYGKNVASFNYGHDGTNWDRLKTGINLGILLVDDSSNASTNIAVNASTVVKATPGKLNMITVNVVGVGSTVALYNDATAPCDTNLVGTVDTTVLREIEFNHSFTVGICALTAGGGAANINLLYR